MDTHNRPGYAEARNIFTNGEVDHAIREGRRLRSEAIRNAFSHLRPHLGPID